MRHGAAVLVALGALALPGGADGAATVTRSVAGDDWSLPAGSNAPNSGFYSEAGYANQSKKIDLRGFDISWRQIQPQPGSFDVDATGSAHGVDFASFREQASDPRPFWMRMFASAIDWAPKWLPDQCSYTPVGPDFEGLKHIPIWDPCVWDKVRAAWRKLMIDEGLRSDPRLRFVYVPGAFTYVEFDYEMIDKGVKQGLTFDAYSRWHAQMLSDLVAIMNGDNDDPSDDYAYKLVFTGEDYPFSDAFGDRVAFFARDAVQAGMGIRNGITELFNFHLGEIPAYGTAIAPDGHLVTDDDWILFDGRRVIGAENECYTTCDFHSKNPGYAVKMSNLKALQMRANWIYLVPRDSRMRQLAGHWAWVHRELGQRPETAPDAWVALREAEDVYWRDKGGKRWKGSPYVRNLERWVVQRDVAPNGVARRGTLKHKGDPTADNGTAFESLRTNVARKRRDLFFDVDSRFMSRGPIGLKVTYRDFRGRAWRVGYRAAGGVTKATPVVRGRRRSRGGLRTVTFRIDDAAFDNGLPGATDFALHAVKGDVEASFVRVVKLGG